MSHQPATHIKVTGIQWRGKLSPVGKATPAHKEYFPGFPVSNLCMPNTCGEHLCLFICMASRCSADSTALMRLFDYERGRVGLFGPFGKLGNWNQLKPTDVQYVLHVVSAQSERLVTYSWSQPCSKENTMNKRQSLWEDLTCSRLELEKYWK